jgi:hypothetical protein
MTKFQKGDTFTFGTAEGVIEDGSDSEWTDVYFKDDPDEYVSFKTPFFEKHAVKTTPTPLAVYLDLPVGAIFDLYGGSHPLGTMIKVNDAHFVKVPKDGSRIPILKTVSINLPDHHDSDIRVVTE